MKTNKDGNLKSLVLTVLIISVLATFLLPIARHFDLKSYLYHFKDFNSYEVQTDPQNIPVSRESPASLKLSEMVEIRMMLEDEQFERLNSVLDRFQKRFEEDQTDEYGLYDAYQVFNVTVPSYEDLFLAWIDATPNHYQPYIAISQYYYAMAWESRGKKFRKDTTDQQINEMLLFFEKAEQNLEVALKLNPNSMIAYQTLIGIYNTKGEDKLEDQVIKGALENFPYSFLIKSSISWAKEPRWGGSYRQMEDLANEAQPFSDRNPKISALYGFIYYDQARNAKRNKNYKKALTFLNKAIAYGDHWSFYDERANLYHYDIGSDENALEDVNRSIELRPVIHESHLTKAKICFSKMDFAEAISEIDIAERIKPGNLEIQKWKKWASDNTMNRGHRVFKSDLREAVRFYDLSIEFMENNFEAYYWRGRAYTELKDYDTAMHDLQAAIDINSHHFESYRMIDYLYAREQQWDKIISFWDRFLELEPNHAGAYYERSGTHYHNHDMENAISDLKKACELGNKDACKRYETFRK